MQNKLFKNARRDLKSLRAFCYNDAMFYVVGLGNPGGKYTNTRHNVGFLIVDHMIEKSGSPKLVLSSQYVGYLSEGMVDGEEVQFLKPETFMNQSGGAVKKLVPKGEEGNLILIYDDVDLALGEIKISNGRGAGGHNGVQSVINSLGSKDFVRIRVGISPKSFWTGKTKRPAGERMGKYVLAQFGKRELQQMEETGERAYGALQTILKDGVEKAMNQYN